MFFVRRGGLACTYQNGRWPASRVYVMTSTPPSDWPVWGFKGRNHSFRLVEGTCSLLSHWDPLYLWRWGWAWNNNPPSPGGNSPHGEAVLLKLSQISPWELERLNLQIFEWFELRRHCRRLSLQKPPYDYGVCIRLQPLKTEAENVSEMLNTSIFTLLTTREEFFEIRVNLSLVR